MEINLQLAIFVGQSRGKKKITNQELCKKIVSIDHLGIQSDDIHKCEEMHQLLREIDKLDRYDAVRLLMHIIHVQQLQKVETEKAKKVFANMLEFEHIDSYIKNFSHEDETLY